MRDREPRTLKPPRFARPAWLRVPRRSLRDPILLGSIAAAVILVGVVAAVALSGRMPEVRTIVPVNATPQATPVMAESPTGTVSPAPTVAGEENAAGTALPLATSAAVPSAPPPATPTPTPDPAVWRFEGRIVNEAGEPLDDVCVVIGPHGCREFGPHTDERGRYYIDFPQNPTIVYELRFQKEGYRTVYYRVQPSGPVEFHVVLPAE